MNKKTTWALIFIIILFSAGYYLYTKDTSIKDEDTTLGENDFDPKNATYNIDGTNVTLVNGEAETEVAPGSASKITTWYFGNETYGDLNMDGKEDIAFLIAQNSGGTGIFYYVVVALKTKDDYKMTNAFFVGDRIAPQTTEINESAGELRVNFAERKPGEPMTADPSVGVTLYLKVTPDGVLEGLME